MKKPCFILCLVCLISLTGCGKKVRYVPQENIHVNYNNVSADNSYFGLTEDTCYTLYEFGYAVFFSSVTENGKTTFPIPPGSSFGMIYEHNNMLYTLNWTGGDLYNLYSYDTQVRERKHLLSQDGIRNYFVLGDYLYYHQEHYGEEEMTQPFSRYSLTEGTTVEISDNILSAGVMGETPVYLVQTGEQIEIMEYCPEDNRSAVLGSFLCPVQSGEGLESYVNFTSNYVLLTVSSDFGSTLVCYDLNNDQVSRYRFDDWMSSAIAYEEYAFLVITNTDAEGGGDFYENQILRICLQTGETEEVCQILGMLNTFVASDDCVYVSSSTDSSHIYRYDANGDKTLVCVQ